ncbi:MAG: signal recognition particle-docking protein FtsY [Armatimonadetes bacterium]|nr:signal recognition particle-docking protein FtsY [Armatimonadota bacterium]
MDRLKDGLKRTRDGLMGGVMDLFRGKRIDEDFWESLEEILITSDVGVATSTQIVDRLRAAVKEQKITEPAALTDILREDLTGILKTVESDLMLESGLTVIMVVGVNGTGKTTTIGKLAWRLKSEGKKVMLAAADTFRAAAMDQLQIWADRVGVDIIRLGENADPAAVAYDAVTAAQARGMDVLIIDTAGRLHNKVNLMEELKKVRRVVTRQIPSAPHETLLVLDATTGQNALQQAKTFGQAVDVSGLVLAKLDGTARGGIVIAIAQELGTPVKFIGIGEAMDDLRAFEATEFVNALFVTTEEAAAT